MFIIIKAQYMPFFFQIYAAFNNFLPGVGVSKILRTILFLGQ